MSKVINLSLDGWVYVMTIIDNNYTSKISKDLNMTFSHIYNICQLLSSHDWVNEEKLGRRKFYRLTDEGKLVAERCKFLTEKLREKNEFFGGN